MTSNDCNVIPIEFIFRFFTTHLNLAKLKLQNHSEINQQSVKIIVSVGVGVGIPASWSLFSRYWAGALGRQSAISSGGSRPLCKGGGWGGGRSSRSLGPLLISTNVLESIAAPSSTMTTFLILLLSLSILIKPITPSTTSFFIFP